MRVVGGGEREGCEGTDSEESDCIGRFLGKDVQDCEVRGGGGGHE